MNKRIITIDATQVRKELLATIVHKGSNLAQMARDAERYAAFEQRGQKNLRVYNNSLDSLDQLQTVVGKLHAAEILARSAVDQLCLPRD